MQFQKLHFLNFNVLYEMWISAISQEANLEKVGSR